jgi:hypothetical protein
MKVLNHDQPPMRIEWGCGILTQERVLTFHGEKALLTRLSLLVDRLKEQPR